MSDDIEGPEVVYEPGIDSEFYIVQTQIVEPRYFLDSLVGSWISIAAFPSTELAEAEAKADAAYQESHGAGKVRVIRVGAPDEHA